MGPSTSAFYLILGLCPAATRVVCCGPGLVVVGSRVIDNAGAGFGLIMMMHDDADLCACAPP